MWSTLATPLLVNHWLCIHAETAWDAVAQLNFGILCADLHVGSLMTQIAAFSAFSPIRPHSHQYTNMQTAVTNWQVTVAAISRTKIRFFLLYAFLRVYILSSVLEWISLYTILNPIICATIFVETAGAPKYRLAIVNCTICTIWESDNDNESSTNTCA